MATGAFPISSSERNQSYPQRQWNGQNTAKAASIHEVTRGQSDGQTKHENEFHGIIGSSPALRFVLTEVERVATTNSTVLILGETGTGKELIARAIHNLSARRECPFVK